MFESVKRFFAKKKPAAQGSFASAVATTAPGRSYATPSAGLTAYNSPDGATTVYMMGGPCDSGSSSCDSGSSSCGCD